MCATSFKLTLEKTSFLFELYITVGRSEHAKTVWVSPDENELKEVGCVPSGTFFLSHKTPEIKCVVIYIVQ